MAPGKDKSIADKDKIPITSLQQYHEEYKSFKLALSVPETEHTWQAIEKAVKRYTAVTRGGACKYEDEYLSGLKDRELSKAIIGCLSTERTQLSAAALLFFTAATRLGHAFTSLIPYYLPYILRLLSRTNKLYVSRTTATLLALIRNTRLATIIPFLKEGMLEKASTHRKGCMQGLLCALGGDEPTFIGTVVDREVLDRRYLDDVERCITIGARDRDIEVRRLAKRCWEIYRSEWPHRVPAFSAPLTPIIRKYLELPVVGQHVAPLHTSTSTSAAPSRSTKPSQTTSLHSLKPLVRTNNKLTMRTSPPRQKRPASPSTRQIRPASPSKIVQAPSTSKPSKPASPIKVSRAPSPSKESRLTSPTKSSLQRQLAASTSTSHQSGQERQVKATFKTSTRSVREALPVQSSPSRPGGYPLHIHEPRQVLDVPRKIQSHVQEPRHEPSPVPKVHNRVAANEATLPSATMNPMERLASVWPPVKTAALKNTAQDAERDQLERPTSTSLELGIHIPTEALRPQPRRVRSALSERAATGQALTQKAGRVLLPQNPHTAEAHDPSPFPIRSASSLSNFSYPNNLQQSGSTAFISNSDSSASRPASVASFATRPGSSASRTLCEHRESPASEDIITTARTKSPSLTSSVSSTMSVYKSTMSAVSTISTHAPPMPLFNNPRPAPRAAFRPARPNLASSTGASQAHPVTSSYAAKRVPSAPLPTTESSRNTPDLGTYVRGNTHAVHEISATHSAQNQPKGLSLKDNMAKARADAALLTSKSITSQESALAKRQVALATNKVQHLAHAETHRPASRPIASSKADAESGKGFVPSKRTPAATSSKPAGSIFSRLAAPTASSAARTRATVEPTTTTRLQRNASREKLNSSTSSRHTTISKRITPSSSSGSVESIGKRESQDNLHGHVAAHPGVAPSSSLEQIMESPLKPSPAIEQKNSPIRSQANGTQTSNQLAGVPRDVVAKSIEIDAIHKEAVEVPLPPSPEPEPEQHEAHSPEALSAPEITSLESLEAEAHLLQGNNDDLIQMAPVLHENEEANTPNSSTILAQLSQLSLHDNYKAQPGSFDTVTGEDSLTTVAETLQQDTEPDTEADSTVIIKPEEMAVDEASVDHIEKDTVDADAPEPPQIPDSAAPSLVNDELEQSTYTIAMSRDSTMMMQSAGDEALLMDEEPSARMMRDDTVSDSSQMMDEAAGLEMEDMDDTAILPGLNSNTALFDLPAAFAKNIFSGPMKQSKAEEAKEDVEEDVDDAEFTMMVSRELSDDELDDLASRYETSKLSGFMDENTKDGVDDEVIDTGRLLPNSLCHPFSASGDESDTDSTPIKRSFIKNANHTPKFNVSADVTAMEGNENILPASLKGMISNRGSGSGSGSASKSAKKNGSPSKHPSKTPKMVSRSRSILSEAAVNTL